MYSKLENTSINSLDKMSAALQLNRRQIIFTLLSVGVFVFLWMVFHTPSYPAYSPKIKAIQMNKMAYDLKIEWIAEKCLKESFDKMNLESLPDYIEKLESSNINECNYIADVFNSMFELKLKFSKTVLSPEFSKRVLGWLDNNPVYLEQAKNQKIINLYNKYNNEEMIFNPLRGKRPVKKPKISDKEYSYDMIKETQSSCDFCNNYTKNTASDIFKRIETDLSYTAANTFKYDKWHGLILCRKHNPLELTNEDIKDMFSIAINWFKKVNGLDSKAQYPEILWDVMPKSGASQVHPHFQLSLGTDNFYGGMRRWLDASKRYYQDHNRNFYDDFIMLHKSLGLTYQYKDAYVILNLIPIKEYELIIIGTNSQQGYENVGNLLHQTVKTMVEKMDKYSWSMGMFLPKYEANNEEFFSKKNANENEGVLNRIVLRITFRTPAAAARSDINGLDMYTSSVLGVDRYLIASQLFKNLDELNKQ